MDFTCSNCGEDWHLDGVKGRSPRCPSCGCIVGQAIWLPLPRTMHQQFSIVEDWPSLRWDRTLPVPSDFKPFRFTVITEPLLSNEVLTAACLNLKLDITPWWAWWAVALRAALIGFIKEGYVLRS